MTGQISLADGSDFLRSLNDGQVKALIHTPDGISYEIMKKKLTEESMNGKVECPDIPSFQLLIPCVLDSKKGTGKSLMDELKEISEGLCEDNGPMKPCTYMCTSGSTGEFKVASLTSQFILEFGQEMCEGIGIQSESVVFHDKPFGWLGGSPSINLAMGCTRITVDDTIPRGKEYPKFVKEALRRERCTIALTNPQWLGSLVKEVMKDPEEDRYILDIVTVLGAPADKSVLNALGTLAKNLVNCYGSTELGLMASVTVTSRDDGFSSFLCGCPPATGKFKIVNPDMEEVAVGEIGEVLVQKSVPALGYLNNEKATADTFLSGGWMRLGDSGFLNDKGQITILGRGCHAILRGVNVIYPGMVEAPLLNCPGLAEVVVTSVPDQIQMQEVCALMVRSQGAGPEVDEEYVRRFCHEKLFVEADKLDFDPIPGYFRFVDAIPKLSNGKEDRLAAKRMAAQLVLGQGQETN